MGVNKVSGKINESFFLKTIHTKCGFPRKEVLQGPAYGVDVALIELPGDLVMAMASDPLTLIPSLGLEESAWLSVHLMANDIATTGFSPQYAQFVLNLPASLSTGDFQLYWNYIDRYCRQLGVSITGGHTGFDEGINSTIAGGGTMMAIAPKNEILLSSRAKPGNVILVTKTCALSSSAILGMSFPKTVINELGKEVYDLACRLFYHTSSIGEALLAAPLALAMHDVTEGGVLGAIVEMAVAAGIGAEVYGELLPTADYQNEICRLFGLDPRFCIGAGSMIIAADEKNADEIIQKLRASNIDCCVVGKFTDQAGDVRLFDRDEQKQLTIQKRDPYWAAYFHAWEKGWT